MKHVNWVIALVAGLAIGYFTRGAVDGGGKGQAVRPPPTAARPPPRPTEDPRAVYRASLEDSPVRGPADALVTIVESSDFECPFCKRAYPTLKQLEEAYPGKLRFAFKHNPLPFHPRAMPSAIAAEEARAEGGDAKFWAMHDALFAASVLEPATIEKAASDAGVDAGKVRDAMASGKYKDRIERDQRLAQSLGATGTPTFFINGRKLVGAQPLEAFKLIVDEELKKAEAMVKEGAQPSQLYARIMERAATAPVMVPGSAPPPQPGQPQPQAAPPAQPAVAAAPPAVYRDVTFRSDDPVRGPAAAELTVVLFSDFQCPFCSRVVPSLTRLEQELKGKVRLVWKHQPLPMHPNALPAAIASEAAREQGKFWPMHDRLFENQQALDEASLVRYAKDVGLDVGRFQKAVAARKGEPRIQEDQKLAARVDASGTPTMFFNCRQVVGARPYEQLKAAADEELRKAEALLGGKKPDAGFYERACKANLAAAPATAAVPAGATGAALPAGAFDIRTDDPVRGNPKAPVTLVLFSDFQCPFCANVEPTLAEVRKQYGDKVRLVWKHQPLPFHPNALPAAEAAEAAREQGKFWEMHDRLFSSQRELSPDTYEKIAREIGLDVRRFQEATRSGRAKGRIQDDQRLAARVGANGTPTMFVNGEKVEGAVPFGTLKAVIDRKLAAR
ncbi:MAG TPA: thioredoxin domain-containing protein [Anaeromyxobacter sp.]